MAVKTHDIGAPRVPILRHPSAHNAELDLASPATLLPEVPLDLDHAATPNVRRTPAISCEPVRPPPCHRAHEAAPPSDHGAAERLVSFIALFGSPHILRSGFALSGPRCDAATECEPHHEEHEGGRR